MGWEAYPEGLYSILLRVKNEWNVPILITENGTPDKYGDKSGPFMMSHISQMKRAIASGVNVMGYTYWSLMDNYEWQDAYGPDSRFGLYKVNRDSTAFERISTPGTDSLRNIIAESNGEQLNNSVASQPTIVDKKIVTTSERTGPEVSISPSCGPIEGFNIRVNGDGFEPNSNINWKLIDSNNGIPLYGYFQTSDAGGVKDSIFADDLQADSYKIAFGTDLNNDNKFDVGAPIEFANLEIPCP